LKRAAAGLCLAVGTLITVVAASAATYDLSLLRPPLDITIAGNHEIRVPAGITSLTIMGCGGGGAGGSSGGSGGGASGYDNAAGGGGGEGATIATYLINKPERRYFLRIGAGGIHGMVPTAKANGGKGGDGEKTVLATGSFAGTPLLTWAGAVGGGGGKGSDASPVTGGPGGTGAGGQAGGSGGAPSNVGVEGQDLPEFGKGRSAGGASSSADPNGGGGGGGGASLGVAGAGGKADWPQNRGALPGGKGTGCAGGGGGGGQGEDWRMGEPGGDGGAGVVQISWGKPIKIQHQNAVVPLPVVP
jgi:hypothetical protein